MHSNIRIILSLILVALWMLIIFTLSNITGTESHTKSVSGIEKTILKAVEVTNNIGITKENDEQNRKVLNLAETLNYPIRKCLHVLEYLILTLLLYNAFYQSGIRDKRTFLFSLLICFLYACTDEFHQLFTERTGQFSDVLIDMIGSILAILIELFINKKRNIIKLKSTLNTKIP